MADFFYVTFQANFFTNSHTPRTLHETVQTFAPNPNSSEIPLHSSPADSHRLRNFGIVQSLFSQLFRPLRIRFRRFRLPADVCMSVGQSAGDAWSVYSCLIRMFRKWTGAPSD